MAEALLTFFALLLPFYESFLVDDAAGPVSLRISSNSSVLETKPPSPTPQLPPGNKTCERRGDQITQGLVRERLSITGQISLLPASALE